MLEKPLVLGLGEVGGTDGVAVKCVDPVGTTCGEGGLLEQIRRSGTKAWVAKRIRYPCSPRRKRSAPSVAVFRYGCAVEKFLSAAPWDYGRKTET